MPLTSAEQMRRDLAVLFGIPALILLGIVVAGYLLFFRPRPPYHLHPGEDLYSVVAGTWDWDGESGVCGDPHTIVFDPAHRVMTITMASPWVDTSGVPQQAAIYDIEEVDGTIRGRIRGEDRRTGDGTPVIWDLVLTSHDSYHWRRTDWTMGGTKEIERCTDAMIPDSARDKLAHLSRAEDRYRMVQGLAKQLPAGKGRVWGITDDARHFLVESVTDSGARLRLVVATDSSADEVVRTTNIPGTDHVRIRSWHLGGRSLAVVETMDEGVSRGILAYEVRKDDLVKLDLARLAYAGAAGPTPLLDSLEATADGGYYRLTVSGDLVVDPGTAEERRICRNVKLLAIDLQESATGWQALNGVNKPRCDQ